MLRITEVSETATPCSWWTLGRTRKTKPWLVGLNMPKCKLNPFQSVKTKLKTTSKFSILEFRTPQGNSDVTLFATASCSSFHDLPWFGKSRNSACKVLPLFSPNSFQLPKPCSHPVSSAFCIFWEPSRAPFRFASPQTTLPHDRRRPWQLPRLQHSIPGFMGSHGVPGIRPKFHSGVSRLRLSLGFISGWLRVLYRVCLRLVHGLFQICLLLCGYLVGVSLGLF